MARLVALVLSLVVAAAPFAARAQAPADLVKIAVLDVKATGTVEQRAVEGLSALIASEVAGRGKHLRVVSGADIRAMIGFEKQKHALGCGETTCLVEIGGALGVDYIVGSEVSVVGGTWLLSLTLVHIGTATPVSRLTKRTRSEQELVDATVLAVGELLSALPRPKAAPQPAPAAAVAPPPPEPEPEPEPDEPSGPSRLPSWLLAGGGLAAAGLGAYFLVDAHAQESDLAARSRLPSPTVTQADADQRISDGKATASIGAGLLVGSAVLFGLAVVLWPSDEGEAP